MYSEQYSKLFHRTFNYEWESEASLPYIRRYAKFFHILRLVFIIILVGLISWCFIKYHSPLYSTFFYLIALAMYFVFYKGAGFTSVANEFAHDNYQKFVVDTIRETVATLDRDNKIKYLALLLEENTLAIQKREKQYNTYFITFLGIIVPFVVYAFNFMSSNTSARFFVFQWAVTNDFTMSFMTLFVWLLLSIAVFGSQVSEYYLLLSNSTPYWKHKAIQKAILDEKYASLY